jgi:hypothetical protein
VLASRSGTEANEEGLKKLRENLLRLGR